MEICKTNLEGLLSLNVNDLLVRFRPNDFEEINLSKARSCQRLSEKNELSGLHFQEAITYRGRLVQVVSGEIFQVAVDMRKGSSTFGKWHAERLSSQRAKMLWIPWGFAYGSLTLSETAEICHLVVEDAPEVPPQCIRWNDNELSIHWPLDLFQGVVFEEPILIEGSGAGKSFASFRHDMPRVNGSILL